MIRECAGSRHIIVNLDVGGDAPGCPVVNALVYRVKGNTALLQAARVQLEAATMSSY